MTAATQVAEQAVKAGIEGIIWGVTADLVDQTIELEIGQATRNVVGREAFVITNQIDRASLAVYAALHAVIGYMVRTAGGDL